VSNASDESTACARIRDAALRLFAEHGVGRATIRDIAAAAGVSSGLVRHHFGSKEALRDACDAYASEQLARLREQLFGAGRAADQAFLAQAQPEVLLLQRYLMSSLLDGSPTAAARFDEAVAAGEHWLAGRGIESPDLRAYAAVLLAMQMGTFLLRDHLSRALDVDIATPAGQARMTRGFVEVFARPLLTAEQVANAHAALDTIDDP
jgi:AcrR family transcriptional regulator